MRPGPHSVLATPRLSRAGGAARFFLLVPLAILILAVVLGRLRSAYSPFYGKKALLAGLTGSPAIAPSDVARLQANLEAIDRARAQKEARACARDYFAGTATVSDESVQVARLAPNRWRVRGVAIWPDKSGAPIRGRWEADLRLGPADDKWHLIDTELLPPHP